MRDLSSLVAATAAESARLGLEDAHRITATFHEAIADAVVAQKEIDDCKRDSYEADISYWEEAHAKALGKAAQALLKMPARWAMGLGVKI